MVVIVVVCDSANEGLSFTDVAGSSDFGEASIIDDNLGRGRDHGEKGNGRRTTATTTTRNTGPIHK
jgi:hypothetical protein